MNDSRPHLEAEINGKRYKAYFCRKNTMKVDKCKECRLFKDCKLVLDIANMKRHFRVLFKCEPKKY